MIAVAISGYCQTAEPPRPLEMVPVAGEKARRIELHVEVDGKPLSADWDETFRRDAKFKVADLLAL